MNAKYDTLVRVAVTSRLRIVLLISTFLYLSFLGLDAIVYPLWVGTFLKIRLAVSLYFLLIFGLSFVRGIKKYIDWIGDSIIIVAGAGISYMIYLTGGAESTYYQGLNLVFLAIFVINSFQIYHNIFAGLTVLVTYILAVSPTGIRSHIPELSSALFFMGATLIFVILLTKLYGKQHYSEFLKTQQVIEAERLKTQFFANISHELRTPLTLILSPLEALASKEFDVLPEKLQPVIETMHHNAVRLLQMVTGLLDFSKLDAGKIKVMREPTDIILLTKSVMTDFMPMLKNKGLSSHFMTNKEPAVVNMDRYIYERILFNLISNAVKFTPRGGSITVALELEGQNLKLSVQDTGIGIPESEINNLFQKFRQVESSTTRRFEGSGLGLALVKEFSGLLGGNASIESKQGQGTTVCVHMIAPVVELVRASAIPQLSRHAVNLIPESNIELRKDDSADESSNKSKPLVLIAEDNVELAHYISELLRSIARVRIVSDGDKALDAIRQYHPDLILSDVMMPHRDGFSLCREVKSNPDTFNIPFVLLTALTHREALLKGWEAGANEYLFKPFHPKELITRIQSLLVSVKNRQKADATTREIQLSMENALEGIARFDFVGMCERANVAYSKLSGLTPKEMVGKPWNHIIHESSMEKANDAYRKMMAEGKAEVELKAVTAAGSIFPMHLVMVKIGGEDGSSNGHYAFAKDVTEFQYRQALEIKSELISVVSHELRTPLHALRESVRLVKQTVGDQIDAQQNDFLQLAIDSSNRLIRLVNRVLDFQKAESGMIELNLSLENMNQVIQEVVKTMNPLLAYKTELELITELHDPMPQIEFDRDRIIEVLINMVDNAIKFTRAGKVTVKTEIKNNNLQVSVSDTGIGIKQEDIPKIFRNFGQLDAAKIEAPGRGTGLGLAISKKIIEQHQGSISVSSNQPQGTVFSFMLPITQKSIPFTRQEKMI